MATAAVAFRKCFIGFAATSSGTAAEVAEVRNARLVTAHRPINATSNDSSGWDEIIDGQKTWSLTGEALHARTDAEQKALVQALTTPGTKYWTVQPSTSQTHKYNGTAYVTGYEVGGATDDATVLNFSIQGTRALAFTS